MQGHADASSIVGATRRPDPAIADCAPRITLAADPLGAEPLERVLRRSLGPTAWAVLTDLRLDARPDDTGVLVVVASARLVAINVGISKDVAARSLRRLIAGNLLRRRPQGTHDSGQFGAGSYELLLDVPISVPPSPRNADTAPRSRSSEARRKAGQECSNQLCLLPPTTGSDHSTRRPLVSRGRYFTIPQAVEAYPGVLTERLIRRLVAERRIAFTYSGRRVVLAEADIEGYLEANRQEPLDRLPVVRRRLA